jgi:recombination protein RecR
VERRERLGHLDRGRRSSPAVATDPELRLGRIDELARLPSIGRKTAQRLALHLLKAPREEAARLSEAILLVKDRVGFCSLCGNYAEQDPCPLCTDPRRDHGLLCVVEQPVDVLAIERTASFRGVYHVLRGVLSPLDGTGPEDLRVRELLQRLNGSVPETAAREVILATNPTVNGEATAMYLQKLLAPLGMKVTRIARGVPVGSDLEYSDIVTLARALEGRKEMD